MRPLNNPPTINALRSKTGDLAFLLQPFRRQFKGPGEDHRWYQTNGECDDDSTDCRIGKTKHREESFHYLDDQPRSDHISRDNAQDVTAIEFP